MPPPFWDFLLLQVRSLSNFPSLSFLYSLCHWWGFWNPSCSLAPLWPTLGCVLLLCLELGVLLGPLSLFFLSFPLGWVLSLMKFARVSLMTLVCIQTIKKLKSLEYLNEEGQVHMSFHESQAREKWEHWFSFPNAWKKAIACALAIPLQVGILWGGRGREISTLSNSRDSTFKSRI